MASKGNVDATNFLQLTAASLLGGVIAFLIALATLILGAVAISYGLLPQDAEIQLAVVSCVIGSFCGGAVAKKRWKRKPLLAGVSAGAILLLILLFVKLVGYNGAASGGVETAAIMMGCITGGAGVGLLHKRKRSKRRGNR